jgi:hypothetical protein
MVPGMREAVGDLWELHARGAVVAVTTNGLVGRDGRARLGRGCARQAGERFPWLAERLGAAVASRGNHVVHLGERLVAFPVEHSPLERPDLTLIARSAEELAALATAERWSEVVLPRPGCGGGGLEWTEVRPVVAPRLDDRFLVVRLAALLGAVLLATACSGRGGAVAPGRAPATAPTAAVHHDLRVTLVPDRSLVLVEDEVTLSPELRARLGDRAVFALHAGLSPERANGGPALAPAAPPPGAAAGPSAADDGPAAPAEWWAVPLAPGERRFALRYGGPVNHAVEAPREESARAMGESPGLVTRDGAVLGGAARWVPEVEGGLVTFDLAVRVPAGWEAISQGTRADHGRDADGVRVRWTCDDPQEDVILVAGPLHERSLQAGRILVETFLRADDAALSDRYLATGARYLAMYERLLGPYPYAKFALVENFWETGYGMPSFTLLGPAVIRLPFILRSSYPHEILHDWWGNGVFVDPSRGNWSEGLTAYLADHLVAEQDGRGAEYRRTALQRYADYVADNQDLPVSAFRARHGSVTQAIGYDKVLMVLHGFRLRLGDARFVGALRRFYAEEKFRRASFTDLARALSAEAGEDLSPLVAQWVDRPGAPALRVEGATVAGDGHAVELVLAQVQGGDPFTVDVPVAVTVASSPEAVLRTVRLSARRQTFTLPVDGVPVRVDVDPEYDVFRRLDPAEVPPALSGAFGAQRRLVVLPSAAPPALAAAYRALAEAWRTEGTEVVRDSELTTLPAGKAVFVLGWENRLRPAVSAALAPLGATLDGTSLRAGATVLARADRAVAAAARSPADAAQVVAFVASDRAAALPGLARKLPHYGRYGLLGFEGDEPANVAKESWTLQASPMTVALGPAPAPPRGPPATSAASPRVLISPDRAPPPRGALPPRRPLADAPP